MTRYGVLLSTMIAESGCTAKEIVKRCNEMGDGIDTARLSKMQSGTLPAPSEKVSRDIARACNADERRLVIEGYIEKAPKEIIEAITNLKVNSLIMALNVFENRLDKKQINELKKSMEQMPLNDVVIQLLDMNSNSLDILENEVVIKENEIDLNLKEPIRFYVKDNGMYPTIPNGSKVTIKMQNEYENGDILAIKLKGSDELIARNVFFFGKQIALTPINKEYETITCDKTDITIIGKITNVIIDI